MRGTIKECLMNILLAEESKDEVHGPYVPIFYEIGYDNRYSKVLMRTQLLTASFDSIVRGFPKEENNVRVPYAITKIAKILQFFYERLQFNHRDLKGDNIMYLRRPDNRIEFKLIDFGLSCLTWKGLHIEGEGYKGLKHCFKEDRDLSQLLYSIVQYDKAYLTQELFDRLVSILQANINNHHTCKVLSDCAANGLKNWVSSYNFFNKPKVMIPFAKPSSVIEEMKAFVRGEPWLGGPLVIPEKPCPPGKVRDPVTKRCKQQKPQNAVPKQKDCPPGKVRDPVTRRCKKIQVPKEKD
jgi:serine/threonine protein kinase